MESSDLSDLDALDALHRANPRHGAEFEAGVAAVAGHTREVLATAALGAAGVFPSAFGLVKGGPNRRARWLLALLAGAVAFGIALVPVTGLVGSAPRSRPVQAGTRPATAGKGPGSEGGAVTAATTSTVPATGVNAGGSTTTSSTAAAPTGPGALAGTAAPHGSSTTGVTVVTHAPSTSLPPATAAPAPPPTGSPSGPTCAVSGLLAGPPQHQSVRVQAANGLASISNVVITNGTVSVGGFARGTHAAVLVVATKTDPAKDTQWSFDATDLTGHITHCT